MTFYTCASSSCFIVITQNKIHDVLELDWPPNIYPVFNSFGISVGLKMLRKAFLNAKMQFFFFFSEY